MDQQKQTLNYFKSHAAEWQVKAKDQRYSVVDNRHKAVLESMKNFPTTSALLDVGCGTGQLAIEASKLGWKAVGLDFAQEMIDLCQSNNISENTEASFICASVFDYEPGPESFDVISAQGFIEYVSLDQLGEFLEFSQRTLKTGGVLALGSRNRLFNLHSLNQFTELETALGTIERLLTEGQAIQTAPTQQDAIAALEKLAFQYDQPVNHPLTGVKVGTRYQFSPADLMARMSKHNLSPRRVFPVHYHPLPLALMANTEIDEIHSQLAKFASDNWITNHNLVPYSSSFVLEAQKT